VSTISRFLSDADEDDHLRLRRCTKGRAR
jgi:hypothetical protein